VPNNEARLPLAIALFELEGRIFRMDIPQIKRQVRAIGARAVCDKYGISRSTLWRLMQRADFPKAICFSLDARARLKFYEHEIDAWLAEQRVLTNAAAEAGDRSLDIHLSR
jgi:predicted DNA-binding transcriptional regulator AlpA